MHFLKFLLPFATQIIKDAILAIPDDRELGKHLTDIVVMILEKAVKSTKTDVDDKLLEVVKNALVARQD